MSVKLSLLFLILFLIPFANTNAGVSYYYIEWNDECQTVRFGEFIGANFKKTKPIDTNLYSLSDAQLGNLFKTSGGSLILYFHCMYGELTYVQKTYLHCFQQVFRDGSQNKTIISILWNSGGLNYKENWKSARDKTIGLGTLLNKIVAQFENTDIFCHSMGGQFFLGLRNEGLFTAKVRNTVLFSPDMISTIKSPDFNSIKNNTDRTYVFTHDRDRILKLAQFFVWQKRLGRYEPKEKDLRVQFYNMTKIVCANIHNHTHYKRGKIQEKLREILKE
jgi:hypothetical protein